MKEKVSEELSSVETLLGRGSFSGFTYVSEELSSVETGLDRYTVGSVALGFRRT